MTVAGGTTATLTEGGAGEGFGPADVTAPDWIGRGSLTPAGPRAVGGGGSAPINRRWIDRAGACHPAGGRPARPGLPAAVRVGIEGHVTWLDEQVAAIDEPVGAAVRRCPEWRAKDRLLRSIKGVGPVVRRTLPADLPELGTLPPGTLSALAGLAPFAAESGRWRGERHIRGGRKEVRRALYMGALAVARVPGPPRPFAQRLKATGKASKVALIAVARKRLVTANAVLRDARPWDPKLATAA